MIKTTEKISYSHNGIFKIPNFDFSKDSSGIGYHSFNYIPEGITGWAVDWPWKEWFSPDDNHSCN